MLKDRRCSGDESFFKVSEIKKFLKQRGFSHGSRTSIQIAQLESFGYLEVEMIKQKYSHWRSFRLKSCYLEEVAENKPNKYINKSLGVD